MMWLISGTCILSARHRLQVLAAEMKDSLEDKRDVRESEGKWHPAYQMPGNVIPPTPPPQFLGLDVLTKALSLWIVGLGVRSSPRRSERRAGCFKADMAGCQIPLL